MREKKNNIKNLFFYIIIIKEASGQNKHPALAPGIDPYPLDAETIKKTIV